MSSPIVVRVSCENRMTLATRRSSCETRSPYICPGSRRLMLTFALLPDSGRPSDCATMALGTAQVAASSGPERLCHVPLTCTSILGIVYAASPLISVLNGNATSQRENGTALVADTSAWVAASGATVKSGFSGRTAATSHASATRLPVLVPPWSVGPPVRRPFTVPSAPCQEWGE